MAASVQNYTQASITAPPRTDQPPRKTDKNQDATAAKALTDTSSGDDQAQTKQLAQAAATNTGGQQAGRGRGTVVNITV